MRARTILERRHAAELSQAELGKLCGVTKFAVSRWELGLDQPRAQHRAALALVLGGSVSDYDIATAAERALDVDHEETLRGSLSVGQLITLRRLRCRVNLRRLARYLEVTVATALDWEEDVVEPPVEAREGLTEALGGVAVDYCWTSTPGSRIRAGREAAGYSVEALAKAIGGSVEAVESWEADSVFPRPGHRLAMIRLLFDGPRVTLAGSTDSQPTTPASKERNDA